MVKPLSAGFVNTGCMLNTESSRSEKLTLTRKGKLTLCGLKNKLGDKPELFVPKVATFGWGEPERAPHQRDGIARCVYVYVQRYDRPYTEK